MNITNLLSVGSEDDLLKLSRSEQMFHDWQAIRLVRDGYLDTWKLLLTYFSWFCFTLLACSAFALKAELKESYVLIFGAMGDVAVLIQIGIRPAVLPLMHSARQSVSRSPVLLDVIASSFVATLASDDAVLFGSSAEATASDGGVALLVSDDDEPPSAARSASSSRWYSSAAISNASRSLDFVIAAANRLARSIWASRNFTLRPMG
jgi:hypothetical protein